MCTQADVLRAVRAQQACCSHNKEYVSAPESRFPEIQEITSKMLEGGRLLVEVTFQSTSGGCKRLNTSEVIHQLKIKEEKQCNWRNSASSESSGKKHKHSKCKAVLPPVMQGCGHKLVSLHLPLAPQ